MNIIQSLSRGFAYLFGGFVELFSPDHDDYPATGVQPFEGEAYGKWTSSSGDKFRPK
jgi:hypothetical protein